MSDPLFEGTWFFNLARAGTMQTSGLRSLLEGAHLTSSEMFVREVTQNSVDAHSKSTMPVSMNFSSFIPTGTQLQSLNGFLLGDGQIAKRLPHLVGKQGFSPDGGLFALDNASTAPRSLLIEDFGTVGLGGHVTGDGPEDHFSRLVYFFGQSHGEGTTGGAFGFGKSVYSVASAVRTVIYYSKPAGGADSRLIAVGLFPSHELDGQRFTGYALCGRESGDEAFPIVPVIGEEADALAASLGMQPRDANQTGTSLLVVDCDYSVAELRQALEKWWWPRLVTTGADGLVIKLVENGRLVPAPNPASRPDLVNFVRAFEHHLDSRQDTDETKTKQIRSTGQRNVGRLTLRKIEAEEQVEDEEAWFTHTVALLRGPRLVVEYAPFGRRHMPPFVGVFVADEGMDSVLRESENPAHDTWSPESGRLAEAHRPYVRAVTKYGKQYAREFQASFVAKPLAGASRYRALEDLLGKAFNKGRNIGPVPQGPDRPVSLSVRERRNEDAGFDEAQIFIRSKEGSPPLPSVLAVTAHVLGDASRSRVSSLEVELIDSQGDLVGLGTRPEVQFVIPPGAPVKFVARARSPKDSAVVFEVSARGGYK